MSSHPDLVAAYVTYAYYRNTFEQTNKIDLSSANFLYPTTLLPLSEIIRKNNYEYTRPQLRKVANYVDTIIDPTSSNKRHSYIPIVELPQNCEKVEETLKKIFAMQTDPHSFGGESPLENMRIPP